MVALDAVARPEEDRLRTSSYHRSPRGTTPCLVLALSRSLFLPLTPPQKTNPQQRLQEAARGDEASVRKVHRRPYFLCGGAAPGGLQRQVDDFNCRQLLILQLDDRLGPPLLAAHVGRERGAHIADVGSGYVGHSRSVLSAPPEAIRVPSGAERRAVHIGLRGVPTVGSGKGAASV